MKGKKYGKERIKRLRTLRRSGEFILQFKNDKVALCPKDWILVLVNKHPFIGEVNWFYRHNKSFKSLRLRCLVPEVKDMFLYTKVKVSEALFVAFIPEKLIPYIPFLPNLRESDMDRYKDILKKLYTFVKWAVSFRGYESDLPGDFELWLREFDRGADDFYKKFVKFDEIEGVYYLNAEEVNSYLKTPEGKNERKFKIRIKRFVKMMNGDLEEKYRYEIGWHKRKIRIEKRIVYNRLAIDEYTSYIEQGCDSEYAAYLAKKTAKRVFYEDDFFESYRDIYLKDVRHKLITKVKYEKFDDFVSVVDSTPVKKDNKVKIVKVVKPNDSKTSISCSGMCSACEECFYRKFYWDFLNKKHMAYLERKKKELAEIRKREEEARKAEEEAKRREEEVRWKKELAMFETIDKLSEEELKQSFEALFLLTEIRRRVEIESKENPDIYLKLTDNGVFEVLETLREIARPAAWLFSGLKRSDLEFIFNAALSSGSSG